MYRRGKGMLIKTEPITVASLPVASLESAAKLHRELWNGAVWTGEPAVPGGLRS